MAFKSMQSDLEQFSVIEKIQVQWGEMDAAQHVNNVVYLRWSETARVAYFNALGSTVSPANGAGFILAYHDCKYIFPVKFPDTVILGVKVTEIGTDRFTMLTHIYSETHQRIAAISKQIVVTFDYTTEQKMPMPESMKSRILEIEKDLT